MKLPTRLLSSAFGLATALASFTARADVPPTCDQFDSSAACEPGQVGYQCPGGGACREIGCENVGSGNPAGKVYRCVTCDVKVDDPMNVCTGPSEFGKACGDGGMCTRIPGYCPDAGYVVCAKGGDPTMQGMPGGFGGSSGEGGSSAAGGEGGSPAAGGGTGEGGSTAAGGENGGEGGAIGVGIGGTTGTTGGTTGATGGTTGSATGGSSAGGASGGSTQAAAPAPAPADDSGGCTMTAGGRKNMLAVAMAAVGAALLLVERRRKAR